MTIIQEGAIMASSIARSGSLVRLSSSLMVEHLQSKLLLATNLVMMINKRGIRAQNRIYRTSIPMVKNNLKNLPNLTGLLVSREQPANLSEAIQIREQKLSVYKSFMPFNADTNLIEALFHPDNDIDRLLRIIDENLITMTSFYIGVSFEVIDDMLRANLCEKSTVFVSPEFERLCRKALFKIRFFEADEILKLIKCLSTLQVPESTLLAQAAFQMTRHLINDLNLEELESLSDSLNTFKIEQESDKSLLVALIKAIPLAQEKLRGLVYLDAGVNASYKPETREKSNSPCKQKEQEHHD